jgi:hypothetical protein
LEEQDGDGRIILRWIYKKLTLSSLPVSLDIGDDISGDVPTVGVEVPRDENVICLSYLIFFNFS